jgi:hypothetical protein
MSQYVYICEDDLTEREINAGLSAGELTTFRVDGDGRQWYRQAVRHDEPRDANRIEYVSEDELTEEEVRDGIAMGELQFWRVAADGKHWFTREVGQLILGIPISDDIEGDDDAD